MVRLIHDRKNSQISKIAKFSGTQKCPVLQYILYYVNKLSSCPLCPAVQFVKLYGSIELKQSRKGTANYSESSAVALLVLFCRSAL